MTFKFVPLDAIENAPRWNNQGLVIGSREASRRAHGSCPARKRKPPAKRTEVNAMELPSKTIDARSYTGLIETLVGMTIKLEVIRQTLDPVDDASSTELISQIRTDAIKAAAFAQLDPGSGNE